MQNELEIIIITYNRKKYLQLTFEKLLEENSPVKNCQITVLDNNSTDDTRDYTESLKETHSNIRYIKNKYNVGGNANIAKAIELAEKKYFWILGDDDKYDWDNWDEVEQAINDEHDCIVVAQGFKNPTFTHRVKQCIFLSGCIYKTSIIDNNVMKNVYDAISDFCPHAPLFCKVLNDENKSFYYIKGKPVIIYGEYEDADTSYTRGHNAEEVYSKAKNMSFFAGIFEGISLLKDDALRDDMMRTWLQFDAVTRLGISEKDADPIMAGVYPEMVSGIRSGEGFYLPNIFNYFIYFNNEMRIKLIKFIIYAYFKIYLPKKLKQFILYRKNIKFFRTK